MKTVIQRVNWCKVHVDGELVSQIGRGLCVLVGLARNDTEQDINFIARKILNIRLFEDGGGKRWTKSVSDYDFEILCVSQFTLHAVLKGNKPDFHRSLGPDKSKQMYDSLLAKLRSLYKPERIFDGKFGAMMQVSLENCGPVTIELDSSSENTQQSSTDASVSQTSTSTCTNES